MKLKRQRFRPIRNLLRKAAPLFASIAISTSGCSLMKKPARPAITQKQIDAKRMVKAALYNTGLDQTRAIERLGNIGKPGIEALVKEMERGNAEAVYILKEIVDGRKTLAIRVFLPPVTVEKDENAPKEFAAAVPHLMRFAEDKKADQIYREYAVDALGKIGDPRAIQTITSLIKESPYMQLAAERALYMATLRNVEDPRTAKAMPHILWLINRYSTMDVTPLPGHVTRLPLPYIHPPSSVSTVFPARTRAWVLKLAVTKMGKPAIPPLIHALNDPYPEIRKMAAELLGGVGHVDAIEPLSRALADPDLKSVAIHALGSVARRNRRHPGFSGVVPKLIRIVDNGLDINHRRKAMNTLAYIGDMRAIPCMIRALGGVKSTKEDAAVALLYLARRYPRDVSLRKAVKPLIGLLGYKRSQLLRGRAMLALAHIGDIKAAPHIIAFLDKDYPDGYAAMEAIEIMAKKHLKDPALAKAVDPLIKQLKNRSSFMLMRIKAIDTLGQLKDRRALPELRRIVKTGRRLMMRYRAKEAIERITGKRYEKRRTIRL